MQVILLYIVRTQRCFFRIRCVIFFRLRFNLPNGPFPLHLAPDILDTFLIYPIRDTCPEDLILLDLLTLILSSLI